MDYSKLKTLTSTSWGTSASRCPCYWPTSSPCQAKYSCTVYRHRKISLQIKEGTNRVNSAGSFSCLSKNILYSHRRPKTRARSPTCSSSVKDTSARGGKGSSCNMGRNSLSCKSTGIWRRLILITTSILSWKRILWLCYNGSVFFIKQDTISEFKKGNCMLSGTLMDHKPYYPLHKVLTFLLFRSDSPQVYTLAMQVKGVGRQRHSCFHHRCLRCRHHQTGRGACRETMGCKNSRTKKGGIH